MDIPRDAYRIFTGPDGQKNLAYIDGNGSVVPLVPKAKQQALPDGYYDRQFKLIKRSERPRALDKVY